MSKDLELFIRMMREIIRAKMINAKREKEAFGDKVGTELYGEWRGQEIAFKQLLDILED